MVFVFVRAVFIDGASVCFASRDNDCVQFAAFETLWRNVEDAGGVGVRSNADCNWHSNMGEETVFDALSPFDPETVLTESGDRLFKLVVEHLEVLKERSTFEVDLDRNFHFLIGHCLRGYERSVRDAALDDLDQFGAVD